MQNQVLSGSRCAVLIGNEPIAAAFVADYSIETMAQEIETIDLVEPMEIAPSRIRISMNLRVFRTQDNDPIQNGQAPGMPALGQAAQSAFLSAKYITIRVKDDYDQTVLTIPKAWIVRRTGAMSAGEFLTENWSILGMGYYGPGA